MPYGMEKYRWLWGSGVVSTIRAMKKPSLGTGAKEPVAVKVGGGEHDWFECPRHIHAHTQDLSLPSQEPQQVQS